MKRCEILNGMCVHQNKDSCDGCKLMELWLMNKHEVNKLSEKYMSQYQLHYDPCGWQLLREQDSK